MIVAVKVTAAEPAPPRSDYRVFFVKRTNRSGFMAGAHVFPGGVLDAADSDPRWQNLGISSQSELDALRVAAAREAFEESGILLLDGHEHLDVDAEWRTRVHDDAREFYRLCESLHRPPDLDHLGYWARWVTPKTEPRRYDAIFYLAALTSMPAARHDTVETVASEWLAPEEALAAFEAKTIFLPPPTWCVLREMAAFTTLDALWEAAANRPLPAAVEPEFVADPSGMALALPGDAAHTATERPTADQRHRIILSRDGYQLLSTG